MLLCKAYHCLIHLPISRESSNESYCEQAFRLIDQRILPPSRDFLLPVTLQAQALRLWKNTPYLRLRDSTGISPVFLSSHGKSPHNTSIADTRNVLYAILIEC